MNRLLTAAVALPILILSVWIPQLELLFVLITVVALTLGLYEFYLLAKRSGIEADRTTGMIFAAGIFTVFYFSTPTLELLPIVVVALILTTFIAAILRREAKFDKMLAAVAATVLGVLYVVMLGGFLIQLRTEFDDSLASRLLTFFFLVLMGSDSAAYYTGRAFGRRKMAPHISPGKTWEGAAGGFVASLAAATLAHFTFFPQVSLLAALPLAAAMNTLGVLGDLTESALKRGAGAKDAASILPGHGGLLDRLDSLLFNAPLIYYFAKVYF